MISAAVCRVRCATVFGGLRLWVCMLQCADFLCRRYSFSNKYQPTVSTIFAQPLCLYRTYTIFIYLHMVTGFRLLVKNKEVVPWLSSKLRNSTLNVAGSKPEPSDGAWLAGWSAYY